MKHSPRISFFKKPIALSVAAALAVSITPSVNAAIFELGDFEITFDSTFSLGTSIRVENRDWANHVSKPNNVNNGFDFSSYHPAFNPVPSGADVWNGEGKYSSNSDNANLNFDAGDAFSTIFKGTHELDIRRDNMGVFIRGLYFYDFEMSDEDRAWTNTLTGRTDDPCRDSIAEEQVCSDFRILDAFFYGDFDIGEMPFSIRVGQQVISWGESALIPHGISELNPVDIARLRAPGAELKEAFIPFGAVWGSLGVTENFNIEAFYQYDWEKTVIPAAGSYFAGNDFAGDGGHFNNVQLNFASNPDMDLDYLIGNLNGLGDALRSGDPAVAAAAAGIYLAHGTRLTLKAPGNESLVRPDNGGQYGLRLSWFLPELNDSEISLYYMNYHSRRPLFSGVVADFTAPAIGADLAFIAQNQITYDNYADLRGFSKVELDYPEDIQLYAFSFNTTVGATAVAGEVSYRQDEPLQIDDVELLFAAMPQQLANAGIRPDLNGISQMDIFAPGERAEGFILSDTLQAQFTLTHLFGPMMGADQVTGLLEVGGVNINDMPDEDVLRLNGPGTARNGGIAGIEGLELAVQDGVETNPFPDEFSWGYRALLKLDFNNVFAGINVSPRIVFSHDVEGITPDPLFMFIEDRKSVAFSLDFDYQNRWSGSFGYNAFFGGVGTTNILEDRDFISFSVKYSI
ncbi:DUF1302 domain-containing protein [Thalassotalea euphylliae]|uniref:DUF1302 domain-containing protein n=1 Tax=Thalassotalea euphylliae TaxID=1655234 RepID=A0A3E0UG02_9GAMM|nr:DUF1302 domain-containing protein [Thalassotalea euphylliae]REL35780.1 DUF1302 domain-containing protein [Thalassotalea euphylliae]